jgi:hypothetical protein
MPLNPQLPLVVAYGGGLNSAAMLCGFKNRGIRPRLILFADTKSEHPHTYEHIEIMRCFTRLWWGLDIVTVFKTFQGKHEGLEGDCLRKNVLPSLAYGRKACSMKHKIEPQNKYLARVMKEQEISEVVKAIGYDAGEGHRAIKKESEQVAKGRTAHFFYPLIEWQWRREDCRAAVEDAGIPVPRKSACFFCPSSKRSEVFRLRDEYPELLKRALAIEDAAQATVTTKRGLGGKKNLWRDWLNHDKSSPWLDLEPEHKPCGCHD